VRRVRGSRPAMSRASPQDATATLRRAPDVARGARTLGSRHADPRRRITRSHDAEPGPARMAAAPGSSLPRAGDATASVGPAGRVGGTPGRRRAQALALRIARSTSDCAVQAAARRRAYARSAHAQQELADPMPAGHQITAQIGADGVDVVCAGDPHFPARLPAQAPGERAIRARLGGEAALLG